MAFEAMRLLSSKIASKPSALLRSLLVVAPLFFFVDYLTVFVQMRVFGEIWFEFDESQLPLVVIFLNAIGKIEYVAVAPFVAHWAQRVVFEEVEEKTSIGHRWFRLRAFMLALLGLAVFVLWQTLGLWQKFAYPGLAVFLAPLFGGELISKLIILAVCSCLGLSFASAALLAGAPFVFGSRHRHVDSGAQPTRRAAIRAAVWFTALTAALLFGLVIFLWWDVMAVAFTGMSAADLGRLITDAMHNEIWVAGPVRLLWLYLFVSAMAVSTIGRGHSSTHLGASA